MPQSEMTSPPGSGGSSTWRRPDAGLGGGPLLQVLLRPAVLLLQHFHPLGGVHHQEVSFAAVSLKSQHSPGQADTKRWAPNLLPTADETFFSKNRG